jgi:predicted nuclease with TOPRIM domain
MEECFKRLEERVREILQGYDRVLQEKEALVDKLRHQDKRINELHEKLRGLDDARQSIKARLQRLIQRIENLGF